MNRDRKIDANDKVYSQLSIWQDSNRNNFLPNIVSFQQSWKYTIFSKKMYISVVKKYDLVVMKKIAI